MKNKNLKNKSSNKMKTASHLLVCGLVLSSSVLPVATALAEGVDQSTTPQTAQTATQESTQPTQESVAPTQESTQPTVESTTPEAEKEPEVTAETTPEVDENGMTPEQVDIMKNSMNPRAETRAETGYVLVNGFYYLNGDTSNAPVMDVTVNYVDQESGAVVGSQTQPKTGISSSVSSTLGLAGLDTNAYGIPYDSGLNVSDEIYINGERTYTFGTVSFDTSTFMNMEDGSSKWSTGSAVLSVPVSKHEAPTPDPEEVSFTVRHVDENGKDIVAPSKETGLEGEGYWVSAQGFTDYTLKEGQQSEYQGTFHKGMGDITFHYVKNGETPTEQGTVTVKHVDIDTGKEIHEATTEKGEVGADGKLKELSVKGYTFVPEKNEYGVDTRTVVFQSEAQTVTLRYKADATPEPTEQGTVTVKYVDAETNKEIKTATTLKGDVDTEFSVESPTIEGYSFDKTASDKTTGKFTTKAQTVTLRYNKDEKPVEQGTVTVKYVDAETNKEIHDSATLKGNVGTDFSVAVPTVDGYTFNKSASDKLTGTYTAKAQTVTVKFDKDVTPEEDSKLRPVLEQAIKDAKPFVDKDKYQAKYVDVLDKAIKAGEKALADNPAPKSTTRAKRDTKAQDLDAVFQSNIDAINTALKDVKANPVTPDPEEQSGGAKVFFVDRLGQGISNDYLEATGNVGDTYSFDVNKIPEKLTYGGRTFYLKKDYFESTVKAQLNGTLTKEAKEIYVVYDVEAPTPDPEQEVTIDVNFVDQDGDAVKESVQIKGKKGDKYDLSKYAVEIDGYKLDKSKLPELTGVLGDENTQVTFHYTAVSEPVNPDNNGNNNGSTDNNSTDTGKTNHEGDWKTGTDGNQSNTVWSGYNPDKGDKLDKNGNVVRPNGDVVDKNGNVLPKTGEQVSPLLTLSGLGVLLAGALGFFYKRNKGHKSTK